MTSKFQLNQPSRPDGLFQDSSFLTGVGIEDSKAQKAALLQMNSSKKVSKVSTGPFRSKRAINRSVDMTRINSLATTSGPQRQGKVREVHDLSSLVNTSLEAEMINTI